MMNKMQNFPESFDSENLERFKKEYRHKLAVILNNVRKYQGTEKENQHILSLLGELEKWQLENFGEQGQNRLNLDEERKVVELFSYKNPDRTISDILSILVKRFEATVGKLSSNAPTQETTTLQNTIPTWNIGDADLLLDKLRILTVDVPGTIFPPGDLPLQGDVPSKKTFEIKFENRLGETIALLNRHGIYTDDLIVVRGEIPPQMMRKERYYLIEIPRLNKQILVCNQVGEAIFVIHEILPRGLFTKLSKNILEKEYPHQITKISKTHLLWEENLISTLFKEKVGVKIDVRSREEVANQLRLEYKAETWADISAVGRREIQVRHLKLTAIATLFGIEGNPYNKANFYALGRLLFGDHPRLCVYSLEELNREVKRQFPTAKDWANVGCQDWRKMNFLGVNLQALARAHGLLNINIYSRRADYLELGRAVYGDEAGVNIKRYSNDEIRAEVFRLYPTVQNWIDLADQRRTKNIFDMELKVVARRFGLDIRILSYKDFLALGRIFYGDDKLLECCEYSLDELKQEILRQYPNAEKWKSLSSKLRRGIEIFDLKLSALGRRFDIKGNVFADKGFDELGRKIYNATEVLREPIPEEIKKTILERYPTAEDWVNVDYNGRHHMKIMGRSLDSLAKILGYKGNPRLNLKHYYGFGRFIYGDQDVLKEYSLDELRTEIKKTLPTAKDWVDAFSTSRGTIAGEAVRALKVFGFGVSNLGTRFGLNVAARDSLENCFLLGRIIYGDSPIFEIKEVSMDQIRVSIKVDYPTLEVWKGLNGRQRRKIEVFGLKLTLLSKKFGLTTDDKPYSNKSFYELGRRIYCDTEA